MANYLDSAKHSWTLVDEGEPFTEMEDIRLKTIAGGWGNKRFLSDVIIFPENGEPKLAGEATKCSKLRYTKGGELQKLTWTEEGENGLEADKFVQAKNLTAKQVHKGGKSILLIKEKVGSVWIVIRLREE